jgi:hypothetical protein
MSQINQECDRINKLSDGTPPHIVLDIPEDSDENVKKGAYRKLALFCHPDRPDNTDKELFTRIFQKITAANEGFNADKGGTTSHYILKHPKKSDDAEKRHFGPIGPEIDEYETLLKLWLKV